MRTKSHQIDIFTIQYKNILGTDRLLLACLLNVRHINTEFIDYNHVVYHRACKLDIILYLFEKKM